LPLYEYVCECGNRFTELHYVDTPTAYCRECGKIAKRVPSITNHTFGFRLSDESHIRFHKDEFVRDV
jgi:putative FmdB family regulatory protein